MGAFLLASSLVRYVLPFEKGETEGICQKLPPSSSSLVGSVDSCGFDAVIFYFDDFYGVP